MLIVEDDRPSRAAMSILFRRYGYQTMSAETLTEASALLKNWQPHCMVLDLLLPDGNGIELLKRVQEQDLPVRIAVTTGTSDPGLLDEVHKLRPAALLQKPAEWNEITAKLGLKPVEREQQSNP